MRACVAVGLLALAGCSTPGRVGPPLAEAGLADAEVLDAGRDAETDAGPSLDALCDLFCDALTTACGAGPTPCADPCKARLATLRGTCPQTFRDYFGCLLEGAEWSCAGPGVARPTGCEDFAEAWQACSR